MKNFMGIICFAALALEACNTKATNENPFFSDYNTPFEIPNFAAIKNEHYLPAFRQGIIEDDADRAAVANDTATPTFKNTIEALEKSGRLLNKVSNVFFNTAESDNTEEITAISNEITPELTMHNDALFLNDKIFTRIKTVYEHQDSLSVEQKRVLEKYYKNFVRGGANLSNSQKEELQNINKELAVLSLQFGNNILAETNNFTLVIDSINDLSGLPDGVIVAAAETAKAKGMEGKWVFTLHNPSVMPFLQYADNRALREEIYKAYINRGSNNNENNNSRIIAKMLSLRVKKANLLGYKNYAEYILDENMAKKPENVFALCNQIWDAALPIAKKEAKDLQEMINKEGKDFKLEGWDWRYYTEKLRNEKYGINETELSEYFPLEQVRKGAFDVANKLYGITFTERKDVPLPNPEASAFEVKDKDGNHVGILFTDYFPRATKRSGAWMSEYRAQSELLNSTPIIINVCNFTRPVGDKPALLTFDEATTLFHEFGHALHGLLSKCKYPSVAGTSVVRDFVELPSQIMENWAADPQVLRTYAHHYKTGEVIPNELIDKLEKSKHFNQGFITTEFMSAALMDMYFHTITDTALINTAEFEKATLDKIGLIPEITVRYRPAYFSHIFSGGYSAGYYAYTWAEVLDADAYAAFKETGDIYNPEKAAAFKEFILSKGSSDDPMALYIKFRGHQPSIEPLLERKGLIQ